MARRYLLSIDGGGIRGIIPAVALAKLEATTGRPARETFSLVAGTSTGAIIAAAIAAGIPASRMVELYVDRAREIFAGPSLLNTLKRIITGSMYSTQRLHEVISEELGPEARGWSLNDSPIDLLITAKGVPNGKAWYFVKDNPANSGSTGGLGLADCTTGSATAPTYFEPWTIEVPPGGPPVGAVVDGGG
jgi:patatin-like phospholipase/acyl hydrolase